MTYLTFISCISYTNNTFRLTSQDSKEFINTVRHKKFLYDFWFNVCLRSFFYPSSSFNRSRFWNE